MPYWVGESASNGTSSGRPSTITTPRMAVKDIEATMSSAFAPITGAIAAIAELPQIELPQATRIESLTGSPSNRPIP